MVNLVKLTGQWTSRIETKHKNQETYYYGFFKLTTHEKEIPVVWKQKPAIAKGSRVALTGDWAQSNGSRPSFNCSAYQILKDPPSQIKINCFYSFRPSPCLFTTSESQVMDKHYLREHYPKSKEVYHA